MPGLSPGRIGFALAAWLACAPAAPPCAASAAPAPGVSMREPGRIEVMIGPGWLNQFEFVGPLKDAMRRGGLDHPRWTDPPYQDYPVSEGRAGGGFASVAVELHPWLRVRADGAIESFGSATGHSQTTYDHYLEVKGAATSVGLLLATGDAVALAAGPTLDFVSVTATRSSLGYPEPTIRTTGTWRRPGFMLEFAVRVPASGPAFASFAFQQHWMGNLDLGPYDLSAYGDPASMPRARVKLNRQHVLLRLGLRF